MNDQNIETIISGNNIAVNEIIKNNLNDFEKINIMIIGMIGTGKSTLINSIFGIDIAKADIGFSITKKIEKKEIKGIPLTIYDTPGLELNKIKLKNTLKEIKQIIEKGNQLDSIKERIHCILYCINCRTNRLDPMETELIKELTNTANKAQVPTIIVITQSINETNANYLKNYIQSQLQNENPNSYEIDIIPVLAKAVEIKNKHNKNNKSYIKQPFGLSKLLDSICKNHTVYLKYTIQHLQNINLKSKIKSSRNAIATTVSLNFGAGTFSLPFSDAYILIPTEIGMLTTITYIFGFKLPKSVLGFIVSSIVGPSSASFLGKLIVPNLLKLIPGPGYILGASISGMIAATITTTLGEAYIKLMVKIWNGEFNINDFQTDEGRERIQNELRRLYNHQLNHNN